ncbi:hypothetical protein BECAL_00799 [Bellilinea caldifistulae]|uniref:NERD domain-containing protein n=1 Tax=Bellilinea caldifistulae TaxID=360411 RepID=A0A0P6X6I1_9CHLR|nr:hypothetical protein [Bellilinea caldifistulae]KPL77564.1 hypothetical protein AC812_03235 [Bellilinea caldifistulae]GAP09649.1 hypothetical protein BECAL_00799 [Bellilinea caldifistulae]
MRAFERPEQERKKLISRDKEASLPFRLVRFSFVLGVVGVIGFFLAFFYQTVLNRIGLPYRQAQATAILVVFIAWVIFTLACRHLGISTRGLTYPKLMSILRNEVETPPDEFKASRKQIAAAFGSLSDDWWLFPDIFADDPTQVLPMVLLGPGGVFALRVNYQDPRSKDFRDPAVPLLTGSQMLEKRLGVPVKPILAFSRHTKHYQPVHEEVKVFTFPDALTYVTSREAWLDAHRCRQIGQQLAELANLPRGAL